MGYYKYNSCFLFYKVFIKNVDVGIVSVVTCSLLKTNSHPDFYHHQKFAALVSPRQKGLRADWFEPYSY